MNMQNESYKTNGKVTYNDYKKKMLINKRQNIMMFVSIFLVLLLAFLGIAKIMSPDIDITLGEDNNQNVQQDEEYSRRNIDSRLRELQEEDAMANQQGEFLTEDDGIVKIPKHSEKVLSDSMYENPVLSEGPEHAAKSESETVAPTQPAPAQPAPPVQQVSKTYRVYVGSYSTQAQAEVAKGILQEANLGVTPHIKNIGGLYTLQVGAFSSHDLATSLSNKLLMNNYPARVVSD